MQVDFVDIDLQTAIAHAERAEITRAGMHGADAGAKPASAPLQLVS